MGRYQSNGETVSPLKTTALGLRAKKGDNQFSGGGETVSPPLKTTAEIAAEAVIAGKLANMVRGGDRPSQSDRNFESANLQNGISQTAAAEMLNVSPRTVATVKAVERKAPELVAKMESGRAAKADAKSKRRAAISVYR